MPILLAEASGIFPLWACLPVNPSVLGNYRRLKLNSLHLGLIEKCRQILD